MASRFSRLRRPLAAVAVASTATVGGALIYRRFNPAPNFDTPVVDVQRDTNGRIVPPKFPAVKSRAEHLAELRQQNGAKSSEYDLLVIGGGATGTGIALDAATRGLKVALVERDDFSSGTSSKSTKLVHGGVRYLEKAVWNLDYPQLQLVMEALRERKTFLEIAPHLSSSLPILLPLQKWWHAPYFGMGTKVYDLLAGSHGLEGSYYMSRSRALEAFPLLQRETLKGALVYYDGQHNDSRMNVSLAMTAAMYGVSVLNHAEVTGLEKDAQGNVCGARVRDVLAVVDGDEEGSKDFSVRAKGVVNATGPFADAIERMDDPSRKPIVAPSGGAHIMLPGNLSPEGMGILEAASSDGRVVFVLPWQGGTLAGTTDAPCALEREPVAKQDEIDFILQEVSKLLNSETNLSRSDVLASWSGIRPLVKDPKAKNTESLVRSHLVTVSPSGLLTCAGGKWTTYRQMAEDAVDEAITTFNLAPKAVSLPDISGAADTSTWTTTGDCATRQIRLVGSHGFSNHLPAQLTEKYGFEADIAYHLATNYGDRAWDVAAAEFEGTTSSSSSSVDEKNQHRHTATRLASAFPFIAGEIRHSVHAESAQTACDALARRTRLAFLDFNAALDALPQVVDIMGQELDWSKARKEHEWREAVYFLKSMGLPQEKLGITRDEVVRGAHRATVSTRVDSDETAKLGGGSIGGLQPPLEGGVMARDASIISSRTPPSTT